MEHRWNKRYPVTTEVKILHHAHAAVHGKTLDIGSNGMFIGAGPGLVVYRRNTMLDIEFVAPASRHLKDSVRYRLPAIVIHSSNEGMGIMFREASSEAIEAWQMLCHGKYVVQQTASAWT